jgi:energy-coupling factor transport system ATP-binding protein
MAALRSETGIEVIGRRNVGPRSTLRLADGEEIVTRRYTPAGIGDFLRERGEALEVLARNDQAWTPLSPPWRRTSTVRLGGLDIRLTFKEIETEEELVLFEALRRFHYRGGGGAGRTVPIIARGDRWDLPRVLGFLELSSNMIASTARKRFFDGAFFESGAVQWASWNSMSARQYSNIICRISRFVIHPELRGSGLAAEFLAAAKDYASLRWHYGGWRPRFIEITADMLRYYKFVDTEFAFMGETEGNEHRLARDMTYLVRKALTEGESMPQGGGGIMTLQRGYASRLIEFTGRDSRGVTDLMKQLSRNPASLDQNAWEALYRLNRRPKPSYICGLTQKAKDYVEIQNIRLNPPRQLAPSRRSRGWSISRLSVSAVSTMEQTSEGRVMQEAFGFVGASIASDLFSDLSFTLQSGTVTLVCGGSGSGKTLLLEACRDLLVRVASGTERTDVTSLGEASGSARVRVLPHLPDEVSALALKGSATLERFIEVTSKCGLAEPQLLVRPIRTLSSGQRYRLAVAMAFLDGCDVLLIDNFCEPLDRYTACSVAKGIRRLARTEGVSILAATSTYDRSYILDEVDQAILLRRGDKASVIKRGQGHGIQESLLNHALPNQGAE